MENVIRTSTPMDAPKATGKANAGIALGVVALIMTVLAVVFAVISLIAGDSAFAVAWGIILSIAGFIVSIPAWLMAVNAYAFNDQDSKAKMGSKISAFCFIVSAAAFFFVFAKSKADVIIALIAVIIWVAVWVGYFIISRHDG